MTELRGLDLIEYLKRETCFSCNGPIDDEGYCNHCDVFTPEDEEEEDR